MASPICDVELVAPKISKQGWLENQFNLPDRFMIIFISKMANNTSQVSSSGMCFLSDGEDFCNLSEMNDNFDQTLDAIKEFIKCKTDILIQKKEKHQQILDNQMMKLDNERKDLIEKSETVMNKMSEAKAQLMQIEHSYFNIRNKLNLEKQRNKNLEEKVKQLRLESERKYSKFYKTSELYMTVINWYKSFLNISIELENMTTVTVTFNETKKDFKGYPYLKLEILDGNRIRIIKSHPSIEEDNHIMEQVLEGHEIILFLNKFRKYFLSS